MNSDVLARHLQTHPLGSIDEWPQTSAAERGHLERSSRPKNLDERQSKANEMNRKAQNNPFASENQGFVLPNDHPEMDMPLGEFRRLGNQQNDLGQPRSLHGADDSITVVMPQTTRYHQAQISSEPDNSGTLRSAASRPWDDTMHEGMNEARPQNWFRSAPLPETDSQGVSRLDHAGNDENARAVQELHSVQRTTSQSLLWQMHNDVTLMPQSTGSGPLEHLSVREPNQSTLQGSMIHSGDGMTLSSQPAGADRYEANALMLDMDFGSYNYVSPGISDFLDFATPRPPLSETPRLNNGKGVSQDILFSVDQVQRMRQLWRGRRTVSSLRMVRSLWQTAVQHEAENVFSRPESSERHRLESVSERSRTSRWGVDDECRERLCAFCKRLDSDGGGEDLSNLTPQSSGASDPDTGHESSLSISYSDGLPTKEVLNASLDLFFQCSHLPFIQKATFDAKTVPESLLLAMHLVGLSSLYPERSRLFVLQYQKVILPGQSSFDGKTTDNSIEIDTLLSQ